MQPVPQFRTMRDSVSHAAIPRDSTLIAVYDDGALYGPQNPAAWPLWSLGLFPDAEFVHITTTGQTLTAEWGDVEWGDLDEYGLARWRAAQAAAGLPQGGGYASLSRIGDVVAVCGPIKLWVAHYSTRLGEHICSKATCWRDAPSLPANFDWDLIMGTQWTDHGPNGENYDVSLIGPGF